MIMDFKFRCSNFYHDLVTFLIFLLRELKFLDLFLIVQFLIKKMSIFSRCQCPSACQILCTWSERSIFKIFINFFRKMGFRLFWRCCREKNLY